MPTYKNDRGMRFGVITLFPEMFDSVTGWGITGRALRQGLWSIDFFDPKGMSYLHKMCSFCLFILTISFGLFFMLTILRVVI